jgi:pimeloyl-ACP methyl ester carboxylesterase
MPFVEVNGARLHVRQEGTGEDLLLLCGLGDDVAAWDAQTDAFAATHRVTVIDNRGVGQSTLPDGEFTVADLAADAAGVCDELGVAAAHVMGFSMGGAIAQELALVRPDLVRTLVLVDSWCTSDRLLQELIKGAAYTAGTADDARAWLYAFLGLVYSAAVHEDGRPSPTRTRRRPRPSSARPARSCSTTPPTACRPSRRPRSSSSARTTCCARPGIRARSPRAFPGPGWSRCPSRPTSRSRRIRRRSTTSSATSSRPPER